MASGGGDDMETGRDKVTGASVSGGAMGLALGWVVMRLLLSMGLSGLPRLNDATAVTLSNDS